MSSESIDLLWDESITKLKQIIQEEEDIQHNDEPTSKSTTFTKTTTSISDAFHHFAKLNIQYTIIASDLNSCYESCVQPQKREDIKVTLECILGRVLNLRHLLVKWCPPNPDVIVNSTKSGDGGEGSQAPFPWEYFDISRDMKELSCSPSRLEMTTPIYFGEDQNDVIHDRNSTVIRLMQDKVGSENNLLERKVWAVEALAVEAGSFVDHVRTANLSTHDRKQAFTSKVESNHNLGPEQAASTIQPIVRGHLSRKLTANARQWLDRFVGLRVSSNDERPELDKIEIKLTDMRLRRKQEQRQCKASYDADLLRLKDVVRDEEGFAMQNELREERIKWITEQTISNNALPDSFEGFYARTDDSTGDKESEPKLDGGSKDKTGKGAKDSVRSNKNKKVADTEQVEYPVLRASPLLLDPIKHCIQIYDERWKHRNIGVDRLLSQQHDAEMAKSLIVRGQVKSELTKKIEDKLLANILKINAVQDTSASSKKTKAKKNEKEENQKAKVGKKAGMKEKPLPGEALPGMRDKSVEEMLGVLVQNGLVFIPKCFSLKDFLGCFHNDRPTSSRRDEQERWVPNNPSAFQLRKSIMEYCILPLGSESMKSNIQDHECVRSILFYGPEGSGKTRMVQTVASEIGALLIHLSSSLIGNSFEGKDSATSIIHMAFTVAKAKAYAPVILYIDNCHEFFLGKTKKRSGTASVAAINTDMQRFQKDLLVYKNQALKKEDRVLVIGCTNLPEYGDVKLMRWKGSSDGKPEKQGFFDRCLYFPRANHTDRQILWTEFIRQRLSGCKCNDENPSIVRPELDFVTLASMSDGFTAGQILYVVDSVLTETRLRNLLSTPLSEHEFARYFPRRPDLPNIDDDDTRFLNFTRQMTNLDSVWKSVHVGDTAQQTEKK